MSLQPRDILRNLLKNIGESLDISETQYQLAEQHYMAVGNWLKDKESPIAQFTPEIYVQGSFRLGTVIKPLSDIDEYDIDLVCELKALDKTKISQGQLKTFVGDRLRANETYKKMLKEGNRCWKLEYADAAKFHMDILPAISDSDLKIPVHFPGAILITDKELKSWQPSNPVGYAEWFKQCMRAQYDAIRIRIASETKSTVQDIPDYKVKTPLQRSIQLLKRHRDVMFSQDPDNRPISIIISTLAAKSYGNEADLLQALETIVANMSGFIENKNGVLWVPNPVNENENFADKWRQSPTLAEKFSQWLRQVKSDLDSFQKKETREMLNEVKARFGDRIVNESASKVFPVKEGSISVATRTAPNIIIKNPNKPWGS